MPTGPGIQEPVPYLLGRVLRGAVIAHARSERRRTHPMVLQVGIPSGPTRELELRPDDRMDHALRVEIVQAMARSCLAQGRVPLSWLTRPTVGPDEGDLEWAAAVGAAGAELGVRLDLVVITRRSWHDPRSGVGRSWTRIRPAPA